MKLFDSHIHLQDEKLSADLPAHITRANQMGVKNFCCNSTCQSDWQAVSDLAKKYSSIIPGFGIHPWFVETASQNSLAELRELLSAGGAFVGEIGLDRWVKTRDEKLQQEIFLAQLQLAAELDLPVSIHCLKAWDWMMTLLKNEKKLPSRIHFHAFNPPDHFLQKLIDAGFYFSFSGHVLYENRKAQQARLAKIPLTQLLLETDAPDMKPPVIHLNKKTLSPEKFNFNTPANLEFICRGIAAILKIEPAKLADITTRNAMRFWAPVMK